VVAADLYITIATPGAVGVEVRPPSNVVVTTGKLRGPQGQQGPQGIPGVDGGSAFYREFIKASPGVEWVVNHGLGRYPNVHIFNASNIQVMPDSVTHLSVNEYVVTFIAALAGRAISS